MLVLSRKPGEAIVIGDTIRLTVVAIHGNRVRLAVTAPDGALIRRAGPGDLANPSSDQGSTTDSAKT
jgi:carbon storage regulator